MVPRRPPRSAVGLPRRVECAGLTRCKIASRRAWEVSRRRRADPVQVETLTPQQVRRVCTADSVSALASDPPRRAGMVCDMLHPYIPYYNRRAVLTCIASGVAVVSWHALEVLRRCDTLQHGAGGIIAVCVGLVL